MMKFVLIGSSLRFPSVGFRILFTFFTRVWLLVETELGSEACHNLSPLNNFSAGQMVFPVSFVPLNLIKSFDSS